MKPILVVLHRAGMGLEAAGVLPSDGASYFFQKAQASAAKLNEGLAEHWASLDYPLKPGV